MRAEIADLVNPVIDYGLRLQERLAGGETLDFGSEQAALKGLLLSEEAARRLPDFGGVGPKHTASDDVTIVPNRGADHFLGIRYALACWLDETFILASPWGKLWNECKIEEALYGTNDRAWQFWSQAQMAGNRKDSEALSGYYLCVMLGFRGELRDQPEKLRSWVENTGKRITREQGKEWSMPAELEPPTDVPPLRGCERFQRMILVAATFVFAVLPLTLFVVLQMISH